jgi:hypothetical protein
MLIIMIVNCWYLHMDASSTIIKEKILDRHVAVGAGQLAVRSATRRMAASGWTRQTAVAVRSGGPAVRRPIAADEPTAAWERTCFLVYEVDGKAVRLTSSFPLALAGEVRSSIWLVLKTIHWLLTLGKGEVHFSGGGELFAFCRCFFQVAHDAEDQEEGQNENESGGIR